MKWISFGEAGHAQTTPFTVKKISQGWGWGNGGGKATAVMPHGGGGGGGGGGGEGHWSMDGGEGHWSMDGGGGGGGGGGLSLIGALINNIKLSLREQGGMKINALL